ncbi:MAG: MFS transporter [Candidatus Bathyarchaeota archaeon]|nr:MFS transporter [Candidatus Bathyarchaeota archaeon]
MSNLYEKIKSAMHGNLGVMIVSSALWSISGNMTSPFYALYVLELGGNYAMIGKILGVAALVKIIPILLGGYLTDKVGRKQITYTMTYLMACVALIRAFAPDYRFLVIAAILEALFTGLRQPSMSSLISDSTTPENRSMSYALWRVGPTLTGVLSPSIFGLIMDRYGLSTAMRWGYISIFAMGALSAYMRQRYIKETLEAKETVAIETDSVKELFRNFNATIQSLNKQAVTFISLDFVFTLALGFADPYFVTYATDALHVSGSQWGFIITLVNSLTMLLVASPSDEKGRVRFVQASMASWPITYLLFLSSGSYLTLMITRIFVTLSAAVGQPAWTALFTDYCPKEHRGRYHALLEICWSLLYGGGNYLGGLVYQNMGIRAPFQIAMALMTVGGIASLIFLKEPEYREQ